MSGGGSLFALPILLLVGLPTQVAIATNTFSTIGSALGSLPKYLKEKKVNFENLWLFAVLSLIGTYIGANLLLTFPKQYLTPTIIALLLFITLVFVFKKKLGIERKVVSKKYTYVGFVFYFLTSILAGFFLAGTGILVLYVMVTFLGITLIEANATRQVLLIPTALMSTFIFAQNNLVDFPIGIVLMIGMILGGAIGARLAIKKGDAWVKNITVVVVLITIAKLILF